MNATDGHELGSARLFASDVEVALADARLAAIVTDAAYEGVVAQVFGIPREQQTFLMKLILTGALVAVLTDLAPRPRPLHPSSADAAMGAAVVNSALRRVVGTPARNVPAAGALIGAAVLAHALHSAVTGSTRDFHALAHRAEARYRHHSAG